MITTFCSGVIHFKHDASIRAKFENGVLYKRDVVDITLLPSGFVQFTDLLTKERYVLPREYVEFFEELKTYAEANEEFLKEHGEKA